MEKLIDAEVVKEYLKRAIWGADPKIDGWVDAMPAADAVPVVRCKDCKNYNTNGCSAGFGWCEDSVVNAGVSDDFYCANGERRDDDAACGR